MTGRFDTSARLNLGDGEVVRRHALSPPCTGYNPLHLVAPPGSFGHGGRSATGPLDAARCSTFARSRRRKNRTFFTRCPRRRAHHNRRHPGQPGSVTRHNRVTRGGSGAVCRRQLESHPPCAWSPQEAGSVDQRTRRDCHAEAQLPGCVPPRNAAVCCRSTGTTSGRSPRTANSRTF